MTLFDAHCHLALPPDQTLSASPPGATVSGRLLCATGPDDWQAVAEASASWPGTLPAYGLHPWLAGGAGTDWENTLAAYLAASPAAWLGEAGLDRLKTAQSPLTLQVEVFRAQLRLARRLDRQVNLHCVKAWPELVELLDAEYLAGGRTRPFIIHSFAGPQQLIPALVDRGAYFTIGPLLSRRESPRNRRRAALLPPDRLLLESDAFLAPGTDAPGDLVHALSWLAEARESDAGALAEQITANSRRLFET